jgi:hypothetical protein
MRILAIDPGPIQSAFVEWDTEKEEIVKKGIMVNDNLGVYLQNPNPSIRRVLCEMVACYGMPVGKEIFETVLWIGRFIELAAYGGQGVTLVYRKDIKMHFCNSNRAKDSNVRQALIDRLGKPGTKKQPGKTYGVSKDMWAALAIALFWDEVG